MRLEIAARAIVGSKEPQEDSWRVFNARGENLSNSAGSGAVAAVDGTLVVVADGIGGYAGGSVASRLACDSFGTSFFSAGGSVSDRLERALDAANTAIAQEKRRNPDLQDMGCTLIGVHLDQGMMTFISVGDSLLLRSRDQEIHRVNVDHSYFEYLDRQVLGSDDPQRWSVAVRDARRRASLTLAVTGGDLRSSEFGHKPQVASRALLAGDVIIAASDGIETLELVQLQNFMNHLLPSGVAGIADGLIRAVDGIGRTRSYQDNTTIVVVAALEGAGLTRVLTPGRMAATVSDASTTTSLFSRLPAFSNTVLLAGVAAFGIVILLVLLIFAGNITGERTVPRPRETIAPSLADRPAVKESPRTDSDTAEPAVPNPNPNPTPEPGTGQQTALSSPQSPAEIRDSAERPPETPVSPPPGRTGSPSPDSAAAAKATQQQIRSLKPDLTFQGGQVLRSIGVENNGQCTHLCLAEVACTAFTAHSNNRCELFASAGKLVNEQGALSGMKDSK
jgi:serine/threonine protein phosphatase PrpC